jgi:outer membrane protein assembly factor BamD (BamD/ComL family)
MQLAELYLLEYAEVDSALKQYLDITEKYPQHPLAPRALYAVAYTLRKFAKDSTRADSVSDVLLSRYPQSPQAKAIAQKSGIPTTDEIGPRELFHKAELALFDRKEPEQAVEMYRKVLELFPESEYAGKALYALAYIHETFLPDSLVALAEYKELAQKHPQSPYAREAAKKIRAVEQAQKMALASGGAGTQASDGTGRANGTTSERGSGSESTQDEGRRFRRPSLRDHLEKLRKEGGTERKVP